MTTQVGVTVAKSNEPWTVVDNIPRFTPGPGEALVKSLTVGLNIVESYTRSGLLVTEWPAILGSDGCGVVLETGEGCTKLKKGDYIFSCMFIGQNKYTPFQETYLVREDLVLKKNAAISVEQACTIGVGLLTTGLAVLIGLDIALPPPGSTAEPKDSWVIVTGGSGNVGQYACQVASLCGYKVLTSCSPSKASLAIGSGANATFDNRAPAEEQLSEIRKITGGKFGRVFDASAYAQELGIRALETCSDESAKYFSSVDDSSEMKIPTSIRVYRPMLGLIGREDDPIGKVTSADIRKLIPIFEGHLETGALKALEFHLVPGTGWDRLIEGLADLDAGKATKKIVVRVQEE